MHVIALVLLLIDGLEPTNAVLRAALVGVVQLHIPPSNGVVHQGACSMTSAGRNVKHPQGIC